MEQKEKATRAQWGSKLGFILAAAGSAVGLGNIWKFPGKAYEGGGGSFILIYIAIVLLIGLPVMLAELSLGRASKKNAVGTYEQLGGKKFKWMGYVSVITTFIITSYYAHVGGWVTRYIVSYATEAKTVYADPLGYFYNLLGLNAATGETFVPWTALIFGAVFLGLTAVIVLKGVSGGIEKFNKVGMPALFVILLVLLVRAVTMPGAEEGLKYMLSCDWSKVSGATVMAALGQAFFSLSLGMSIMITYGSYVGKQENLAKNTVLICGMDTAVALLAGFIIVPAVFATMGSSGGVGKGGGFAFASLAGVFEAMPGGAFFGLLFYMLLFFAAITSCISLVESLVAFVGEEWGWSRKKATIGMCVVMFLLGCVYTLSQASFDIKGIWWDFANGITYPIMGDFMEFLTDRLLIPVVALGSCILCGWVWGAGKSVAEVRSTEGAKFPMAPVYTVLVKYVAPIAIVAIVVYSFVFGTTVS